MVTTTDSTYGTLPQQLEIKEKVEEQLLGAEWITDKLAQKIGDSHYISRREMNGNDGCGQHPVRIIVEKGNKADKVKVNLILLRSAIKAERDTNFQNCTFSKAPNSGELDLLFGGVGQAVLADIPIAEYRNNKWSESKKLKVIGIRFCPGKQSPAHIYPLIG